MAHLMKSATVTSAVGGQTQTMIAGKSSSNYASNLHHGVLFLENLTGEEMKTRLKKHKLPISGTKIQMIKRLKLAQLPDDRLKEMCRSRGLPVGSSGRDSVTSDGKKKLTTRRDMICALEKFPATVNLACSVTISPASSGNGRFVAVGDDDLPIDGAVLGDDGCDDLIYSNDEAQRFQAAGNTAYIPGYRSNDLLNCSTGEFGGHTDAATFDAQSQVTSSTTERILEWLTWRPVSQCRECKKLLPSSEQVIVSHLAIDHSLDYEAAPPALANSALLFKVTSFESIMSMYVWCRPTSTFRELVGLISRRWMEPCEPCNHIATIYVMPETGSRPQSVFYNQFHDKVDLGPMFDMKDTLHAHLVEILQRRPLRLLFGERLDVTQIQIQYCKQLNIKPAIGPDGREVQGGILAESTLPEIPCTSCGRISTMTVMSRSGGLCHASRRDFFCGKRCAKQCGYAHRLVKLGNSPRCSSCRCAVFVNAASTWQLADEEEHQQQAVDVTSDDIGTMGDFSQLSEAIDEIAVAGSDGVTTIGDSWKRLDANQNRAINDNFDDDDNFDDYDDEDVEEYSDSDADAKRLSAIEEKWEYEGDSGDAFVDKDATLTNADITIVSSNNSELEPPPTSTRLSMITNTVDAIAEKVKAGQKAAQRLVTDGLRGKRLVNVDTQQAKPSKY